MSHDFSGVDWQTARYDDKEFAPGDPYEVARLGKRIADTAKLIEEQAGRLDNLVDGHGWDSDAGRAFQEKTRDTVGLLTKTHQRYAAAASALGSTVPYEPIADTVRENWATALNHAQNMVRTALKKAQAADADGSRYQKQIDQHPGPDEHPDKHKLKLQKDAADGELEAAKRDLRRALEYRDTQAGYAAKAIRDALDHDGLKDPAHHWWDGWKDWVAEVGHWAGVAAAALGVLALVLSWVPILGEVLGALALIASVVALVCDTVSALDGKGTWLDVAIDAVGVLSFGAGRILGTTAKEAAMAARASSAVKDFQLAREVGLNSVTARDLAEALNGVKPGEMSKALAEGPAKLLPRMKSVVKETFNLKGYVNDIRDAPEVHAAARAFAEEAPKMSEIADSSFKTMAGQAKALYYGSQALPLLAGWANLAHTHPGEPFVTGPNWFQGAKELPVIGASGTPFYNWHWSTSG